MLSIGELARLAGVTVKTVRFYSDRGLLPEADRSSGGHRRYDPQALDRLQLIRSLRALDLPVPEVGRVLDTAADPAEPDGPGALDSALEDAVARQLTQLGSQLTALRWREAALRLLHECTPAQRAERLRLIGGITTPPSTAVLARFWRLVLPARLPTGLTSSIVDAAVPQPPADPAPGQVLAFARLTQLVSGVSNACLAARQPEPWHRPALLYDGLREAYELALPDLTAGHTPAQGDGAAVDCFVAAHARSLDQQDTPAFRRSLTTLLTRTADPVMTQYWSLAADLTTPPTLGAAHTWLHAALDATLAKSGAGA
ncbi:MerR family transcriptional regulator [Streptomyces tateyamensis]|uniref:MerR family transcriptional regulator n=1 Tax=Streptomyces tateyamensis TaxID=565073 RepID=A0A2V4N656_9ACTN|nr:MerR family transcriptional regulator [Streptomyces tateyamensis]